MQRLERRTWVVASAAIKGNKNSGRLLEQGGSGLPIILLDCTRERQRQREREREREGELLGGLPGCVDVVFIVDARKKVGTDVFSS